MSTAEIKRPTPSELRSAIVGWWEGQRRPGVDLTINDAPQIDSNDYYVAHELTFHSASLLVARLEIWITDDGATGIQLEKHHRIGERLKVKSWSPQRCAWGHEPVFVPVSHLRALLECVASGGELIRATITPFGLGKVGLNPDGPLARRLTEIGYPSLIFHAPTFAWPFRRIEELSCDRW